MSKRHMKYQKGMYIGVRTHFGITAYKKGGQYNIYLHIRRQYPWVGWIFFHGRFIPTHGWNEYLPKMGSDET
jgi:hypothetical protein